MLKRLVISLFCLFSVFSLQAKERGRPFCILTDRKGAGLFSMFSDVLALVDSYDQGIFQGIEVDFGEEGLYWVNNYGPNWWSYYCEPIILGEKRNIHKGTYDHLPNIVNRYYYKSREEANRLIQKYFRFRPYLLQEVEEFVASHFADNYVIGVHYRGTDAPGKLPYEVYINKMQQIISELNTDNYKIFVATDDELFINFIDQKFPNKVCYQQGILRSENNQPLHFNAHYDLYLQGKEALMDCLLLSKSSCLVLSYSNLSLWAAIINPYIPAIDLSKSLQILNWQTESGILDRRYLRR